MTYGPTDKVNYARERGLFITLVPKVYNKFLIRWLSNFGDFSKF